MLSLGLFLGAGSVRRFTPARLFANGEQGGWWDPSDFSTMFQDSAGTTPVTAVGQPVGLIRDKSGRGNHLSQATTAKRPTLQRDSSGFSHLLFDGVDDALVTASINLSATNKTTIFGGFYKLTDAARGMLLEFSAIYTTIGCFAIDCASPAGTGNFRLIPYPDTPADASGFAAPIGSVLTGLLDFGAASNQAILRANGVQVAAAGTTASGNMANQPLNIGMRNQSSIPWNGRLYSLILRGAASSAAQMAQAERYVGSKMGIVL